MRFQNLWPHAETVELAHPRLSNRQVNDNYWPSARKLNNWIFRDQRNQYKVIENEMTVPRAGIMKYSKNNFNFDLINQDGIHPSKEGSRFIMAGISRVIRTNKIK